MRFVFHPFKGKRASTPKRFPTAVLEQDDWDDYGFKTTFTAKLYLSAEDTTELGVVKILHFTQSEGFTPVPEAAVSGLDSDYCSFGGEFEYYEKLLELGPNIYEPYLRGLGDIAFDDARQARFEDLPGYRASLMRFSGAERTLGDARGLFAKDAPPKRERGERFGFTFKTSVGEDASPFSIDFDFHRKGGLPSRLNAIIGYNGSGKTTLLSNLAIVASGFGYESKDEAVKQGRGRFVGTPPPFKTVLVVSYSAFDTFPIPTANALEKDIRGDGSIFGYVYCGIRVMGNEGHDDYVERLKTHSELEHDFTDALGRIQRLDRTDALRAALRPLLKDASFARIGITSLYTTSSTAGLRDLFRQLSSGHKIVLQIIAQLVALMNPKEPTLVLMDEPETHLHPPLLATLLRGVRECLKWFDGYAVVATHSPVVLQETPSRYVRVLRRVGNRTTATNSSIETFGENIGVIAHDVFNLDDGSTDWHATLMRIAATRTLAEVDDLFDGRLGFAARSFVLGAEDDTEEGQ